MDTITLNSIEKFIQLNGPLFEAVQGSGVFSDSKTFVDCLPKSNPKDIIRKYNEQKEKPDFDLEQFIRQHFEIPGETDAKTFKSADSMWEHIEKLWGYLGRQPDKNTSKLSTLIPLSHPYIVPGGRFREIYYWDTYFTAEGLAASGHLELVESLCRNFAELINLVGHMPNGNRYYFLSRSQPPFFAMLVDLYARHKGIEAISKFIPAIEKEYQFWMDGRKSISNGQAHRRVVNVNGTTLNRYWDDRPRPREESWREDVEVAKGLNPEKAKKCYRDLRAGAESGWDYSSRWFEDGRSLETICTTDILPVDLNALLYYLETKLAVWSKGGKADRYAQSARQRKEVCNQLFWRDSEGYYFDYDWKKERQTEVWSLAGIYPLFVGMASDEQAASVAETLEAKFLKDGGLVTTLRQTGQQWDYPNGWAPLQWMAVRGLRKYGHQKLAQEIAERWLSLNKAVFERTGKMMEKYNVCDLSLEGGGGEYPLQDGFGWTNGVAVALKALLGQD